MAPGTVHTVGHSTRSAEEFVALLRKFGVQELVDIRTATRSRTNLQFDLHRLPAIMCAEAVRWRGHRSLVAEALLVRGHDVRHIIRPGKQTSATLRDFAVTHADRITHPGTHPDTHPGTHPGGERCST